MAVKSVTTAAANSPDLDARIGTDPLSALTTADKTSLVNAINEVNGEGGGNELADPGDAGAIPVTGSGVVNIVSVGVETRTLAVPGYNGQRIGIHFKTDGGDVTITVASAFNQDGDTTIVLDDAGDYVELVGVELAGVFAWREVSDVERIDADLAALGLKTAMLTRELAAAGGKIVLLEGTDNGVNKVTLQAPASLGADRTITVPDADVDLGTIDTNASKILVQSTAPTLTPGAENANVIAVVFASPVASVEQYLATIYRDTIGTPDTAAFRLSENGLGAEVHGTATGRLIFTTDANGAATLDALDVAGASGATCIVMVEPLFVSADVAQPCAKAMVAITFD